MTLKRINPEATIYHYFEKSVTEFALYDDDLDMPVSYGSKNLVDGTVRKLDKSITIIYYKRDMIDKISFKKKVIYSGKKEMAKQTKV
jgi:hypothetical protein